MTKGSDRKKRRTSSTGRAAARSARDGTIYVGILIIGAFGLLLWWLLSPDTWGAATVGFLVAVAFLMNQSAYLAWRGGPMPQWRQALARLVLRAVGYGRRGGKPLEAAHGHTEAKTALLVSIALCILIILAATVVLIPEVRG